MVFLWRPEDLNTGTIDQHPSWLVNGSTHCSETRRVSDRVPRALHAVSRLAPPIPPPNKIPRGVELSGRGCFNLKGFQIPGAMENGLVCAWAPKCTYVSHESSYRFFTVGHAVGIELTNLGTAPRSQLSCPLPGTNYRPLPPKTLRKSYASKGHTTTRLVSLLLPFFLYCTVETALFSVPSSQASNILYNLQDTP